MIDDTTHLIQFPLFDPIQIPLTKGKTTLIDPIDSDLAAFKWYSDSGTYAVAFL